MSLFTDSYSRFGNTPSVVYDHPTMGMVEIFGTWQKPSVLTRVVPDDQITRYVVRKEREGRPDLIANEVYGVSELDWVIIAYNKANQVFNWPKAGDVIKIPSSSFISAELL